MSNENASNFPFLFVFAIDQLASTMTTKPDVVAVDDDEENFFEVERILDVKVEDGETKFLIKWKTYDDAHNTWEPEENLSCPDILNAFWKERQKRQQDEKKARRGKKNSSKALKKAIKKHAIEYDRKPPEVKATASSKPDKAKPADSAKFVVNSTTTTSGELKKMHALDDDDDDGLGTSLRKMTKKPRLSDNNSPKLQASTIHKQPAPSIDINQLVKTAKAPMQSTSPVAKYASNNLFRSVSSMPKAATTAKAPSLVTKSVALNKPNTAATATGNLNVPQQQTIIRQSPTPEFSTPPSSPSQNRHREASPIKEVVSTPPSATCVAATNTTAPLKHISSGPAIVSSITKKQTAPTETIPPAQTDPRTDLRLASKAELPFTYDAVVQYRKYYARVKLECNITKDSEQKLCDFMKLFNNENQTVLKIVSFIPFHVIERSCKKHSPTPIKVIPLEGGSVAISKLKGVLIGNMTIGTIFHMRKPTETIMIMSQVQIDKLMDKPITTRLEVTTGTSHLPLYMVYLEGLPLRPGAILTSLQQQQHVDKKQLAQCYSWEKVAHLLKFPEKLSLAKQNKSNIVIYGHSENSSLLRVCAETLDIPSQPTSHVMMFDRFNAEVFRKTLFKHKKKGTQIWEFGARNTTYKIDEACELFPQYSGGFITTDVKNMVHNPTIINTICQQVEQLNKVHHLTGVWKFLVPYDVFKQLKAAILGSDTAQKVQTAVVNLTIGLSKNCIDAERMWPPEPSHLKFMDRVARSYYKSHQYFIYADDANFIAETERRAYPAIDFIESTHIITKLVED